MESKQDSESVEKESESRGTKRPLEENNDSPELPQELKEMCKPLDCELCGVSVTCTVMAYTHYQGKAHIKKVNAYMKKQYNVENAYKKNKQNCQHTKCEICNIEISSEIVYQQHIAGKQHKKNLKKNVIATPVKQEEVDPTGRFNIGKPFLNEEPPSDASKYTLLFCDICKVFANTPLQMDIHKQGQKHTKKVATLRSIKQVASVNSTETSEYYNKNDVWQATPSDKNTSDKVE